MNNRVKLNGNLKMKGMILWKGRGRDKRIKTMDRL